MSSTGNYEFFKQSWPKDGIEVIQGCPVCNSPEKQVLYSDLTDKVFYCAPGSWQFNKCIECGCGYLNPRPNRETIHLAYRDYYTHQSNEKDDEDTSSLSFFRYIRRALANGYLNKRFGSQYSPAWKLGIYVSWLFPDRRKILDRRLRNLPKLKKDGRLLDVGFGSGDFLKLAQDIGWSVYGADPDPVVVEAAKDYGLEVRQGGIEAYADMRNSFDAITLSHVIEHVHEPQLVLKEAFKLLKPGGQIWIETPNIESVGHEYFGSNWRGLEPPRHIVIFNWSALESLLKETGFDKLQRVIKNIYTDIAQKSRALKDGKLPSDVNSPGFSDILRGWLLKFWTKFNHTKSEFIILIAIKPDSGAAKYQNK